MERTARVGVLMGGLSGEHAVSLKSGRAVAAALRQRGWDTTEIVVGRDLPEKLREHRIEAAWIALHGRFGEDGCVQGLLEVMGIPYTGSDVRASAVAMDKIATKRALRGAPGITLADDLVYRRGDPWPEDVRLPVCVKPAVGGSTIGASIIREGDNLEEGVAEALRYHHEVLLEEFIDGEEITVAVLGDRALPVVRIVPDSGFFDFEAKYTSGRTHYEVPAQISDEAARLASHAARVATERLGCRGLCRVDFLVPRDGRPPVFLEVNTIPGMTPTSLSPMAASAVEISFEELVERILLAAQNMPEEPH